ncbi:LysR family transcriptional regulator (plasmid) [Rhizobium beringeri]|jgi:DNA-binding transcriptional LysR family regulator|nr:LysR family transcriptional regulator [Rhizobium beringeri]WSH18279.1 LysR family transcriptional regulator [Rhizobium beringeri]
MDLLRAIEAFVKAADAGSMAAAARPLGISATQVGNRITALEERLHAKLLIRSTRRLDLTSFGRDYLERCREILYRIADAELLAEARQAEPRGHIRVTAPVIFGSEMLLPGLACYLERYPEVSIDVDLTDTLVDIDAAGFDAAIRIGSPPSGDFVARPLAPYGLMICAAPSYLARRGAPLVPSDLAGHDCLLYGNPGAGSDGETWRLIGPDGPISIEVAGQLRAYGAQGLRRAAGAGIGIALLPDVIAKADVAAGLLCPVLEDYRPAHRPLNILFRRERHMSRVVRSLVDHVLDAHGLDRS